MSAEANPFGSQAIAARQGDALVAVEQSRAIAETQAAMVIAKKFPRDPIVATDRILNACSRPTLADQALYAYSRGGSDITGPSIRLAEMLAQNWGNLAFGIRELEQRAGTSTVEAFAWDIETNVRQTKTFQVQHVRDTKKGSYALTDGRDIYETVANQGARRLRACILGVIPGDVVEAAVNQCEVTMKAKADTSPEAMKKMEVAFEAYGVTREQIEARIQRRIEAIQPAQVASLKKIYASLRDGMSVPADWFEVAPPVEGEAQKPATGAAALKEAAAKRKPKPAADPTAQQEAELDGIGKPTNGAPTVAAIGDLISKAATLDQLAAARDLIRSAPEEFRESLDADAAAKLAELSK